MIDLEGEGARLPDVLSDVTGDGAIHALYYVTEQGGKKHPLGIVHRTAGRWLFKAYKNQEYSSDDLWLIMRYVVDLTHTFLHQEKSP